jgi:signal transduction histidine kinase
VPPAPVDADRLKQALLNVITNAADAMPTGGTLRAATRAVEGGAAVQIEIADDGEGMDADVRERVFEPFFTTKREGIGLGLANTRSILERHGGRIVLEPADGHGTRALVTLPAATPPGG